MKLTDERIDEIANHGTLRNAAGGIYPTAVHQFARAVEAEVLRINGGGGDAVNISKIIDAAVSKFLGWKLPFDFAPDAGISYDLSYRDKWGQPSGTNLLNALQAKYMFECCLREALPHITDSVNVSPTTDMCRAAVKYVNGADIYEKVPPGVTEIEEEIYREVWLAMQEKAPQQAAPGAVVDFKPDVGYGSVNTKIRRFPTELIVQETPDMIIYNHEIYRRAGVAPGAVLEGWQPIETAPKGRKLLLGYWNKVGNWRTVTGCYYPPQTLQMEYDRDDLDDDGYAPEGWYEESETQEAILPTDEYPTHWVPLPAAPSAPKLQGGS